LEPLKKTLQENVHVSDQLAGKQHKNEKTEMFAFKFITDNQTLMSFVSEMQNEKQYIPPIRILFVGNDIEFNDFIQEYVT
jgi:hypothetical protein